MRLVLPKYCPICKAPEIQPSRPRRIFEHALFLLFLRPFRCHHCNHRFLCPSLASWRTREA